MRGARESASDAELLGARALRRGSCKPPAFDGPPPHPANLAGRAGGGQLSAGIVAGSSAQCPVPHRAPELGVVVSGCSSAGALRARYLLRRLPRLGGGTAIVPPFPPSAQHLRHSLGRMAPASSAQDSASALRDGGPSRSGARTAVTESRPAAVGGGGLIPARRLRSRLDIHPYRSAPTAPSLPWQCPRYADGATGGRSTCFLFWRSWRHRSRCGARRRGGGAPRGSGIDPDAAAPPDTERPSCRPARSSGFVSSAGLPLLALQERDGPRPGRRGWVPSTAADECALQMQPSALPVYPRAGNQRPHRHRLCRKARQASRQACGG